MLALLAAASAEDGNGVNVLPIALVVLLVVVAAVVWKRRR